MARIYKALLNDLKNMENKNSAIGYSEGSEELFNNKIMTEEARIENDAAIYSRYNYNHDVVEGAEYRGYIAGATAELKRKDSEIHALKEALKWKDRMIADLTELFKNKNPF